MYKEREQAENFAAYLVDQEKSKSTVEKYTRDVRHFLKYVGEKELNHGLVMQYKEHLSQRYKVSSINSMLIAVNGYLNYIGRGDCCVRNLKVQRQIFREESKELNKTEYRKLIFEARRKGKKRLAHIIQTLGMTGIRISELKYITVESLKRRMVRISNKGKLRIILLPQPLVTLLTRYCRSINLKNGSIFVTRTGQPVDRKNVWAEMKKLCLWAGVEESKVFPHNLRHLFARCYYEKEKDLVRLADFLGHSSIETTRRYTMISTMEACLKELERGLMVGEEKREARMNM